MKRVPLNQVFVTPWFDTNGMSLRVKAEGPDLPEEGEPCWWRCINGHWMYGTHCPGMIAEDGTPEGEHVVVEICPFCYVEWIGSHVPPMKRVDG